MQGFVLSEVVEAIIAGKTFCLHEYEERVETLRKKYQQTCFSKIRFWKGQSDIRAIWEQGRLQQIVLLAQAAEEENKTNREPLKILVGKMLKTWLEENRFGYGVHYLSAMECGLRIPVFLLAVKCVDRSNDADLRPVVRAIYQHGWLIRRRLSLYSSLGNHTVAEAVGLVFAGSAFHGTKEGREWLARGIHLLEQECGRQILDDGGPVEQSFSYHRFVLDLYWLAIEFLEINGLHDCSLMAQRADLGEKFLAQMQQPGESLPMVGDSDDGNAVAPGLHPRRGSGSGAVQEDETFVIFAASGYSLFRDHSNGLRVLFDHGRLGMEPLNNHGHADALSVWLSVGDRDFLIDPGTYRYNGVPQWRSYFKGTSAHNTVCIDWRDQARQLTGFIWDRSYAVDWNHGRTAEGGHRIVASHNGYRLQRIPVTHNRTVTWGPLGSGELVVEDRFVGEGVHDYALHFHVHPRVEVVRDGNVLRLIHGEVAVRLSGDVADAVLLRGSEDPIVGWYSAAYGKKEPTTTIRVVKRGVPAECRFVTRITLVQ